MCGGVLTAEELAKKVSEKEGVIVTQTLTVGVARVVEMQIKNLEAERDFYKKKLVDIEELVTVGERQASECVEGEGERGVDGGAAGGAGHGDLVGETACRVV